MSTHSFKVSDSLFLTKQQVSKKAPPAKPVEIPTNHVLVIDCSGSMYGELPKIREQLKRKLPKMVKETDTVSIIWFSGRGQFSALLEGEPVATLTDLAEVNKAIDRWLQPQGLTGFKEPLEEVAKLTERVAKRHPKGVFSLMFLSDGCDNCWPRADVLKAVEKAGAVVSSSAFVEYGYYADRPLLTAMAEKAGGSLVFAEHFDKFEPMLENVLAKRVSSAPRIEVRVDGDAIGGFAFTLGQGEIVTYAVEAGSVRVPEDTSEVWYLSPTSVGLLDAEVEKVSAQKPGQGLITNALDAAYASLSLFAQRMKSDVVFALLKATGDVAFIEQFANCFGKQRYSEFVDATKEATFDASKRLTKGFDPNKVPKEDAFTVFELLRILAEDEGNKVLLDSSNFTYNRIGRARVDAGSQLTDEEQAEVAKLTSEMAKLKDAKKIKDLSDKITAITASKPEALKFSADPVPDGVPISNLTFNEERPNVSILVRRTGTVDLSTRIPDTLKGKIPEAFPAHIFRNYAVIKDGLVNVEVLPVRLTSQTTAKIMKAGLPPGTMTILDNEILLNLKVLPVINRKMVRETSARFLFETSYELTKAQAAQKVYNDYVKTLVGDVKRAAGLASQYGDEAAAWLKEQGITDGGFSPKQVQAEATDVYMGKKLKVSLKGLSSLPKVSEVKEKMAKSAKLNAGAALMVPTVKEVDDFIAGPIYKKAADQKATLEKWLEGQAKSAKEACRDLIYNIAQTSFCVTVGQIWFKEFSSLDENTLTIDVDGQKIDGKVEMLEEEIKI